MEYKRVERFQISPCVTTSRTLSCTQEDIDKLSSTVTRNESSKKPSEEPDGNDARAGVALNLCPSGSKINISCNETTIIATESSLTATIGPFNIRINCQDGQKCIIEDCPAPRPPVELSLVAVVTTHGYPLHVALEDSPCVKATHSLSAIFSNQNTHLVTLYSTGQGAHYLSANNYNYYVAIDSDNNIQALPAAEIDNVDERKYTCKRENLANDKARYYFEIGGNKRYLKATSDGALTTQHADNLADNQPQSTFTHLYG